eukprot:GHVQ01015092.1.p2 GENE.GHVQ01015092.1~~GHVQ01015092.1.p2  ORF type:complete len:155 (-),score=20.21 GHVQ01015092.1:35-499(-)
MRAFGELVPHGGHQVGDGNPPGISDVSAGVGLLLQEHGQKIEQPLELGHGDVPAVVSPDALAQEVSRLLDVLHVLDDIGDGVHDQDGLLVEVLVSAEVSQRNLTELGEQFLISGVGSEVPEEKVVGGGLGVSLDVLPVSLDGLSLSTAENHDDC